MKKAAKILAIILLISVVLVSFVGCKDLDEMRANQGFWQQDGSILFKGNQYILLPESDKFSPEWTDGENYITQQDVPVLLSQTLGDWVDTTEDNIFILFVDEDSTQKIYCRKDKYDEMKSRILTGVPTDTYCYWYSSYDEQTWEYETNVCRFTDSQKAAIDKVFAEVKPEENSGSIYWDAQGSITIEKRSHDMLFYEEFCDIVIHKDRYYVVVSTLKENVNVYAVPEELEETFGNITAEYIKNEWEFSEN